MKSFGPFHSETEDRCKRKEIFPDKFFVRQTSPRQAPDNFFVRQTSPDKTESCTKHLLEPLLKYRSVRQTSPDNFFRSPDKPGQFRTIFLFLYIDFSLQRFSSSYVNYFELFSHYRPVMDYSFGCQKNYFGGEDYSFECLSHPSYFRTKSFLTEHPVIITGRKLARIIFRLHHRIGPALEPIW